MTDILGSRPVYVGEKSGRTFVSNRFNLVKECDSVKPVAGSTLLHLTSSGIRISRMRHQSKSEGGGEVNLRESLQEAVRRRVQGKGRVAVSFSGGLDSSTLATLASKTSGVKLFTVYLKGSRDDSLPIDVADRMGLDWKGIPVTEDLVSSCARSTISSRMWRTRMDYSLGIGFRLVSEAARVEGFDLLLAGQGADELFGGYHKYCALEGKGLKSALSRDQRMLYLGMARDAEAIREGGCQPSFPFLDEDVVLQARRVGVEDYIHKGTVKVALRKVAMELGLPDRVVQGPKKAFQYSSGLQKVVQKLFF
jgi:asparagine synthase (glutamine-hydrolysing)